MGAAPAGEPWAHHEDDHVLVVVKPAGVNTHRADQHAQDGMHEWVQRQRPAVSLSVLHRLDKGTSGLLVFGKSPEANRSLTAQFEARTVTKRYDLLVEHRDGIPDRLRSDEPLAVQSGDGRDAATDFERQAAGRHHDRWTARPHTGRTHQVRIHAAGLGMPVVGDDEHGGSAGPRLFLHAGALRFEHPTGGAMDLSSPLPASFTSLVDAGGAASTASPLLAAQAALEARTALFDPADTDSYLWIDRSHDGFDDLRVERYGDVALAINYGARPVPEAWADAWREVAGLRAVHELRRPRVGGGAPAAVVTGDPEPASVALELGLRYRIDLAASPTSSGLFLDQRETRRELLHGGVAGQRVLNTFAHTGSLSVAAAAGGAETLTLDLSKHYLDWARDNLRLNDIDPAEHDFIYGDAMDWMDRLMKKGRVFDLVIVDPPSSSTTKKGSRWSVDRDLHALVERAARLCSPGGRVYVSTNHRRMQWSKFLRHLERGLDAAGRTGVVDTRTLPIDHRSGPGDPPYLKAAWLTLDG